MISLRDPQMAHHRALVFGLIASLLVHALALALFRGGKPGVSGETGPRVLIARLAPRGAAPAPEQEQERQRPAEPRPERIERTPRKPPTQPVLTAPAPSAVSAPSQTVAPSAPAVPAAAPAPAAASSAAAPMTAQRAAEPQAPAAPATGESAARPPSDADGGTLAQYRLALIGVARRYKRYPAQAMEKGWQGRVEVRLIVGSNGMTQSAAVRVSSGYEILDAQALDMVKKAKPLTPIPPSLRGREFTVDIPVIFDLQSG